MELSPTPTTLQNHNDGEGVLAMNLQPLVSVGLPFYNNERTLPDAIRSVFAQTLANWELIMVDDGSSDGSLGLAESVEDARVRVISDGENRKLPFRLNQIAQLAAGKYLARLDADDLLHPQRLEKQIAYLENHPETDLVDTGMYLIDDTNILLGARGLEPLRTSPAEALRSAVLNHATVTGKTQWFRDNPYDTSFVRRQDYELWCRTCEHSIFARIPEPLYLVRKGRTEPRKYMASLPYYRRIFYMYGPRTVGWPRTLGYVAQTYITGAACVMLSALGQKAVVQRRKARALTDAEAADGGRALEAVLSVNLPVQKSSSVSEDELTGAGD